MDIKHKHMEANLMGTTFNDVKKEPSFQMHRYVQCDSSIKNTDWKNYNYKINQVKKKTRPNF
jgi:hypothetical protein